MIHILKVKELVNGVIHGDEDIYIKGPCGIKDGEDGFISYIKSSEYAKYLKVTKASVIIVDESLKIPESLDKTFIKVKNASIAFIDYLKLYKNKEIKYSIEKSARIATNVKIDKNVHIGNNVVIEEGTKIFQYCKIESNSYIGRNCIINKGTIIKPNVTIHSNTKIGKNCKIKSSTVIGSSGFGLVTTDEGVHHHIPHVGNVIIEDDVIIGSGCTIDRATINETIIGKGTKFDNQVHIGHNVQIGENCIICAQVAVGGSTKIYNNVIIGGQTGIIDNLSIYDNAIIGPKSFVVKSIKKSLYVSGNPAIKHRENVKKNIIISKLPEIYKKLSN